MDLAAIGLEACAKPSLVKLICILEKPPVFGSVPTLAEGLGP